MTPSPRHFLNTQDWSRAQLDAVLAAAAKPSSRHPMAWRIDPDEHVFTKPGIAANLRGQG